MEPNYTSGDILLVTQLFYFFRNPVVSDIVVLKDPRDKKHILKRITKIDDENMFVLGDNQSESTDSRHFGFVHKKQVIGKVIYKF